jgi:hypothetical protein
LTLELADPAVDAGGKGSYRRAVVRIHGQHVAAQQDQLVSGVGTGILCSCGRGQECHRARSGITH